jgi:hypothetical protein
MMPLVPMRNLLLCSIMAAAALPAVASRHVTVAQLEKALATSSRKHRPDIDVVHELSDFVLTERLTDAERIRISDSLHLDPRVTLALQLLADESALLDPPAAELPAVAAPNPATAQRIFTEARAYVTRILPHLPDFLATRTTYSFDNSPQVLKPNEWPVPAGLHLVGESIREITFQDDQELSMDAPHSSQSAHLDAASMQMRGPETWGEFGKLLAFVFIDVEKGEPSFHHWERLSGGLVAVFRYKVPKSASHYSVNYCCISDELAYAGHQVASRRGAMPRQVITPQGDPSNSLHKTPGYHGSLFIDPATGAVLRITLEADMGDSSISTVIEYGSVTIGDRSFICPLRSMALTQGPPESSPSIQFFQKIPFIQVNETSFSNYHRLGSTMRIITNAQAPPAPQQ